MEGKYQVWLYQVTFEWKHKQALHISLLAFLFCVPMLSTNVHLHVCGAYPLSTLGTVGWTTCSVPVPNYGWVEAKAGGCFLHQNFLPTPQLGRSPSPIIGIFLKSSSPIIGIFLKWWHWTWGHSLLNLPLPQNILYGKEKNTTWGIHLKDPSPLIVFFWWNKKCFKNHFLALIGALKIDMPEVTCPFCWITQPFFICWFWK